MSIRCGIDLGTTYSAISFYDENSRHIETIDLEHADGRNTIPSVVYYQPGGGVIVGEAARNAEILEEVVELGRVRSGERCNEEP